MCIYTCNMFMQIFAFKNKPTCTLNNTEYQRPSLKKKESLIPLANFSLEYAKSTLSFLPVGNVQSCSFLSPTEKLNPYCVSTAIPNPTSFLSKSDFFPGPVHNMVPLLSRKRGRRGEKVCYHAQRKEEKTGLRGRNKGICVRKGNKCSSSSSFPYPILVSILNSPPFLHSSRFFLPQATLIP